MSRDSAWMAVPYSGESESCTSRCRRTSGRPGKRGRDDTDVEMPTGARAGVAGMCGAVVADDKFQRREARLEQRADPLGGFWRRVHGPA